MTQEGTLRVWWIRNAPAKPDRFPVKTIQEAIAKIEELSEADQKNDEIGNNAGGLEVFRAGRWQEWDFSGFGIEEVKIQDGQVVIIDDA